MGLLERAHAYKDKVQKGVEASVGLFTYPVLMSADILAYDATHVPVGADQKQHVEMARDMAGSFNRAYGETFVLPEPLFTSASKVPGLDGQKMSKSYGNTIEMFAPEKKLKDSVMRIVTDSRGVAEPKEPETNLIHRLYVLMAAPAEREEMARRLREGGYGYGDAKKELLRKVLEYFGPFRARRAELERKPEAVLAALEDGARRARAAAQRTIERVRRAVGLR
jgi:tryptophanyl-tRNA synthetase